MPEEGLEPRHADYDARPEEGSEAVVRQRGSHVRPRKPGGRRALVVPLHREIREGTVARILRDAGLAKTSCATFSRFRFVSVGLLLLAHWGAAARAALACSSSSAVAVRGTVQTPAPIPKRA